MNIKTEKEIKTFFIKLIDACREKEIYLVIEKTEKMGVNYKQVEEWVKPILPIHSLLNCSP